jgi:hypothetical protein
MNNKILLDTKNNMPNKMTLTNLTNLNHSYRNLDFNSGNISNNLLKFISTPQINYTQLLKKDNINAPSTYKKKLGEKIIPKPILLNNIEIIVSRYNEDLEWMMEEPFCYFKYTVYNKGDNEEFNKSRVNKIINLPNVGFCDHTYLYHIVNNYNTLSNITVFFPGSIDIPYKKKKAIMTLHKIIKHEAPVIFAHKQKNIRQFFANFSIDKWKCSHPKNITSKSSSILAKSPIRPYKNWYTYHFGNRIYNDYIIQGIFSVHKLDIIYNSITHYKSLLETVDKESNPEAAHYMERSWLAIFNTLIFTKLFYI